MHMTDSEPSGINQIWADLLVEELIRAGVGLFCIAPGSRSAPLALAVAAHPRAQCVMHYDERGTAFCALGYGRATRRPAAWITTSGTAVANGMPAVVEASMDAVPMLLVTSDRPPELRATGANQTIDQVKIFGNYVRWQFDLPTPDPAIDPAVVLTTADQAVYRATRMPAGPVHLNVMYREPLFSDFYGESHTGYLDALRAWRDSETPYTRYGSVADISKTPISGLGSAADISKTPISGPELATDISKTPITHFFDVPRSEVLAQDLRRARRGLVVAGRLHTRSQADAVRRLAQKLGWPLLPDVCSQLRFSGASSADWYTDGVAEDGGMMASRYDLALVSEAFRASHAPDAVLYFGGATVSTRLNFWLADVRPALFAVVRESPDRMDPGHCVTEYVETGIAPFCQSVMDHLEKGQREGEEAGNKDWTTSWATASDTVARTMDEHMPGDLSEPAVARFFSRHTPDEATLVLASSMPIRDMDMFGDTAGRAPFVAANRGASGIDGAVATAVGLAYGRRAPVTLLVGDLGLLHDLNSLALAASAPAPVVIVVINNHGGGIFSFLPVARCGEAFEPMFGTPHPYRFEQAARMFGLGYDHVHDMDALSEAYAGALASGSTQVIEVTTDRAENLQLHRRLEALICERFADAVPVFTNNLDP